MPIVTSMVDGWLDVKVFDPVGRQTAHWQVDRNVEDTQALLVDGEEMMATWHPLGTLVVFKEVVCR